MAGSWTIVHSKTFDRKFSEYAAKCEHFDSSQDDAEIFVKRFRALVRFNDGCNGLRKKCADPTTVLEYYAQDSSGNLYYTLKIKKWIGYYYVSFSGSLAVALFIAHESDAPTDTLTFLVAALKDFNADK